MTVSKSQQATLDKIDEQMAAHKLTRSQIKAERDRIAQAAEAMGNDVLTARRRLGIPAPNGKEFGQRMLRFQIGLRALALGMQEPNFRITDVPERLRQWLTNPIEDHPATDDELRMYAEMLLEHEVRGKFGQVLDDAEKPPKQRKKASA